MCICIFHFICITIYICIYIYQYLIWNSLYLYYYEIYIGILYGIHRFKLLVNCQLLIIYIIIQDIYTQYRRLQKKNIMQGERGKIIKPIIQKIIQYQWLYMYNVLVVHLSISCLSIHLCFLGCFIMFFGLFYWWMTADER